MKTDNYKALFSQIPSQKAPLFVISGIESKINRAQRQRNLVRGTSYAIVACLAIAACIPAIKSMVDSMIGSGFTSYISMILTDGSNILGSWKELGMVLVESIPLLSVTAVLALVIGSLYSVSRSWTYMRNAKHDLGHNHIPLTI